ncbi:hypothetical protein K0M31_005436, partial [Melipona bicolor]
LRNNVSARSYRPRPSSPRCQRDISSHETIRITPKLATFTVDHSPINHSIRVPFQWPADVKRSRLVAFTWHKGQGTNALFWFTAAAEYPAHDPVPPLGLPAFCVTRLRNKTFAHTHCFQRPGLSYPKNAVRLGFPNDESAQFPFTDDPTISGTAPLFASGSRKRARISPRALATAINIGEIEDVTDKSPSQPAAADRSRFSRRFLTACPSANDPGFCFLVELMEKTLLVEIAFA